MVCASWQNGLRVDLRCAGQGAYSANQFTGTRAGLGPTTGDLHAAIYRMTQESFHGVLS